MCFQEKLLIVENKIIQGAPKHSVLQQIDIDHSQIFLKGSETNTETQKNFVKYH